MLTEGLCRRKEWLALLSLGILVGAVWFQALRPGKEALTATFLNVGQGDSIFIRTPSGETVLVDGGGRPGQASVESTGVRIVEPFLRRHGINRIDLLVLSHPHDDHLGGLLPVLRDFQVGAVLDPQIPHPSPQYRRFLELIASRKIRYRRAVRGQVIDFHDGVRAEVLNPPAALLTGTGDDTNNNSIVLRFTYAGRALMLTGDAGEKAEEDVLSSGAQVRSDVLKTGHHGSNTATSSRWLAAVRPSAAVISVGRHNNFGHPSPAVLERLRALGVSVYRTDLGGAVTVRIDKKTSSIHVSTEEKHD